MRSLNMLLSAGIVVLAPTTAVPADLKIHAAVPDDGLPPWATLQQDLASVMQAGEVSRVALTYMAVSAA